MATTMIKARPQAPAEAAPTPLRNPAGCLAPSDRIANHPAERPAAPIAWPSSPSDPNQHKYAAALSPISGTEPYPNGGNRRTALLAMLHPRLIRKRMARPGRQMASGGEKSLALLKRPEAVVNRLTF